MCIQYKNAWNAKGDVDRLIRGLYECGIRMPEDIPVVSFGDIPFPRHDPPLATIHCAFCENGRFPP